MWQKGGSDSKMQSCSDVATILIPVSHSRRQWLRSRTIADQSSRFLPHFIYVLLRLSGSRGSALFSIGLSISARCSPCVRGSCVVRSHRLMWTTRNSESAAALNYSQALLWQQPYSATVRSLITIYRTKCISCTFLWTDTDFCLE